MNKLKTFGIFLIAAIGFSIAGCSTLEAIGDGMGDLFGTGGNYTVVDATNPNATVGDLMASPTSIPSTLWNAVWRVLIGFVPALAGWEAVLALFFRRKREHYVKAIKAAVPYDANVDMSGFLSGILAALGANHSSETTKETWEEEEYEEEA